MKRSYATSKGTLITTDICTILSYLAIAIFILLFRGYYWQPTTPLIIAIGGIAHIVEIFFGETKNRILFLKILDAILGLGLIISSLIIYVIKPIHPDFFKIL